MSQYKEKRKVNKNPNDKYINHKLRHQSSHTRNTQRNGSQLHSFISFIYRIRLTGSLGAGSFKGQYWTNIYYYYLFS